MTIYLSESDWDLRLQKIVPRNKIIILQQEVLEYLSVRPSVIHFQHRSRWSRNTILTLRSAYPLVLKQNKGIDIKTLNTNV